MVWGKHWSDNSFDKKYGLRQKHPHVFPTDFTQKDPMAWIYPVKALGKFRYWMDNIYVTEKFGTYLKNKAKKWFEQCRYTCISSSRSASRLS
ncbi:hypothetical protein [Photobacterium leiognathi]|uniref:hypothetical protein n=1 Tax=Photobacterium leiognathi TaxID=553611 RepID=UPI0029812A84|nr:hypothetical protein [Photobacterium leiognathi]